MKKQTNKPSQLAEDVQWLAGKKYWYRGQKNKKLAVGPWTIWRKDGQLWKEMEYNQEGQLSGIYCSYHPEGQLAQKVNYKNDQLDGDCFYYRKPKGSRSREPFPYEFAKSVSNEAVYCLQAVYQDGQLLYQRFFDRENKELNIFARPKPQGVSESAFHIYNPQRGNRDWLAVAFNEEGQRHGTACAWDDSGQLIYEGNYCNGKKEGCWQYYTSNKQLIGKEQYTAGDLDGKQQYFAPTDDKNRPQIFLGLAPSIKKIEQEYQSGQMIRQAFFLADKQLCNEEGKVLEEKTELSLTARGFFPKVYAQQLGVSPQTKRGEELSNDYLSISGTALPKELVQLYDIWSLAKTRTLFDNKQLRLPQQKELIQLHNEGHNSFEQLLLRAQSNYPYPELLGFFTNTVCLGQAEEKKGKKQYNNLFYIIDEQHQGKLFLHRFNDQDGLFAQEFNTLALACNLNSYLFGSHILRAFFEENRIDSIQFKQLLEEELRGKIAGQQFQKELIIQDNRLGFSDFNYKQEINLIADHFQKSYWIIELFRGHLHPNDIEYYHYQNNQVVSPKTTEDLAYSLQQLCTAYWTNSPQLQAWIEAAAQSPAILLQDAASFIQLAQSTPQKLGCIPNLNAHRAQFLAAVDCSSPETELF